MTAQHRVAAGESSRRPLRVLIVEDSPPDATLLLRALERGGFDPQWQRVDSPESMEAALEKRTWDLVVSDHNMPDFSAPKALELIQKKQLDVPFIIVSGFIDEETAIAAMRAGAHDYIMKERLGRLVPAVERELREAEIRRAHLKSEEELRKTHEELEARVEKRTADLKAANEKLHKVIEERKRLENELLDIAENERRRIGFDLHDDLGQKLAGASLMIKGLQQKLIAAHHPCADDARNIHALIESLISHTHNLAHQFSSLDLQGDSLSAALKGLAGNVHKLFNLPCAFSVKGAIPSLPENTTLQLYKIAQEAISNAIKHGKAKKVSISLYRQAEQLSMTVKNDGLPFSPPPNHRKRMGLRIMNYRASTIGAALTIEPNNKSGTVVTCSLGLKNGAKGSRGNSVNTNTHRRSPSIAVSADGK
jgi:signal transduction histidine kinase